MSHSCESSFVTLAFEAEMDARKEIQDKLIDEIDARLESLMSFAKNPGTGTDSPSPNQRSEVQKLIFDCASALQGYSHFCDEFSKFVREDTDGADSFVESLEDPPKDHNVLIKGIQAFEDFVRKTVATKVQDSVATLNKRWDLKGDSALKVPRNLTANAFGEEMNREEEQEQAGKPEAEGA